MRGIVLCACLIAAPAVATPVVSYGAETLPAGLTKVAAATPDKIMCVSDSVTGSRLETARTCRTAAAWLEVKRQQHTMVPFLNLTTAGCPTGTHCAQ